MIIWNEVTMDPATMMVADILALQYLYGANDEVFNGNDSHALPDVELYSAIWDPSGEDTVDQSEASQGWYIELPSFEPSSIIPTKVGMAAPKSTADLPVPEALVWLMGEIENATGSKYSDELYGTEGKNTLKGNNGNDTANIVQDMK